MPNDPGTGTVDTAKIEYVKRLKYSKHTPIILKIPIEIIINIPTADNTSLTIRAIQTGHSFNFTKKTHSNTIISYGNQQKVQGKKIVDKMIYCKSKFAWAIVVIKTKNYFKQYMYLYNRK